MESLIWLRMSLCRRKRTGRDKSGCCGRWQEMKMIQLRRGMTGRVGQSMSKEVEDGRELEWMLEQVEQDD